MIRPEEYIERIKTVFKECREAKRDRFSTQWGHFSREMNMQLKTDTESARTAKLRSRYNWVFVYWIEMSKCLQQPFPDFTMVNHIQDHILAPDPLNMELDEASKLQMIFGGPK